MLSGDASHGLIPRPDWLRCRDATPARRSDSAGGEHQQKRVAELRQDLFDPVPAGTMKARAPGGNPMSAKEPHAAGKIRKLALINKPLPGQASVMVPTQ